MLRRILLMKWINAIFPSMHKALQAQQQLLDAGFQIVNNSLSTINNLDYHQSNSLTSMEINEYSQSNHHGITVTVAADYHQLMEVKQIITDNEGHF